MSLEQIIAAVRSGKTVCWENTSYRVIVDRLDQWFVACRFTPFVFHLVNRAGELNAKPEQFFVVE